MEIRNRMADVVKLRCNACQAFLRMYLSNGWQQKLYDKAHDAVTNGRNYKDKYIAAYEKMRDKGIESYQIDEMDVTLVTELVTHNFDGTGAVQNATRKALEQLRDDRNITGHSNENEDPEELYLRGLLALCNLRNFVRTVDKYETCIEDEKRLSYRKKYAAEIEELKTLLDDERIRLVQWEKDTDKDIRMILESENPISVWLDIQQAYLNRYWKLEKDRKKFFDFIVKASDAGVIFAHSSAASYFIHIKKDYEEAERRIFMLYNSGIEFTIPEVHNLISNINSYIKQGNEITGGMQKIIDGLKEQGVNIEKTEDGTFEVGKKKLCDT